MIPDTFPTVFLDRGIHALKHMGEMVIQLSLTFNHRLDRDRLARAVDRLMDGEPLLGCRLEIEGEVYRWRRLDRTERAGLLILDDPSQLDARRTAPFDVFRGPLLEVVLLPGDSGDEMLLRVAHEVADAGAVKQIARRLSDIYTRLADEPEYVPSPNLCADRNFDQVTRLLPFIARFSITWSMIKEGLAQSFGGACATVPMPSTERTGLMFVERRLSPDDVSALKTYGRRFGATLNDLFLTAGLRSLAVVSGDDGTSKKFALNTTVDLRRYLPSKQSPGICNLSGIETVSLGKRLDSSYEKTLVRVVKKTRARKKGWFGLNIYGSPLGGTLLKMSYREYEAMFLKRFEMMTRTGKLAPSLTNMGEVPDLPFDGPPTQGILLAPPVFPPGVVLGLSGYRDTLTLSASAYGASRSPLDSYLEGIRLELMQAAR